MTKTETNELTDILYNNFYKKLPNYGTLTQCFFPRNAILFLDKSGYLKEYILICFHCDSFWLDVLCFTTVPVFGLTYIARQQKAAYNKGFGAMAARRNMQQHLSAVVLQSRQDVIIPGNRINNEHLIIHLTAVRG